MVICTKRLTTKYKHWFVIFLFFRGKIHKKLKRCRIICKEPINMLNAGLEREKLWSCVVFFFGVGRWKKAVIFHTFRCPKKLETKQFSSWISPCGTWDYFWEKNPKLMRKLCDEVAVNEKKCKKFQILQKLCVILWWCDIMRYYVNRITCPPEASSVKAPTLFICLAAFKPGSKWAYKTLKKTSTAAKRAKKNSITRFVSVNIKQIHMPSR